MMTATFVVQLMLVLEFRHPKMSALNNHPRQAAGVNPALNTAAGNLDPNACPKAEPDLTRR
jgi:hypothetical protein